MQNVIRASLTPGHVYLSDITRNYCLYKPCSFLLSDVLWNDIWEFKLQNHARNLFPTLADSFLEGKSGLSLHVDMPLKKDIYFQLRYFYLKTEEENVKKKIYELLTNNSSVYSCILRSPATESDIPCNWSYKLLQEHCFFFHDEEIEWVQDGSIRLPLFIKAVL